ncbi:hypothetical protein HWI79_2976 [Cryptosporidium felis]|nr:hypothetical protein HWI79_2976 [Cryptosporidium felis]
MLNAAKRVAVAAAAAAAATVSELADILSPGLAATGVPKHVLRKRLNNLLNHGEMLHVLVSLEKQCSSVKLHQDAPKAPHITRHVPSQIQNNFGSSVLPGVYHATVIVMLIGSRPEIDQSDFGPNWASNESSWMPGSIHPNVVVLCEKDVFEFKIRVR